MCAGTMAHHAMKCQSTGCQLTDLAYLQNLFSVPFKQMYRGKVGLIEFSKP